MSFGFLATNNNNQVLISSDTRNLHFIGKATYASTLDSLDSFGGMRRWLYRIQMPLTVTPLPFITMPTSNKYGISAVRNLEPASYKVTSSPPVYIQGSLAKTYAWGTKPTTLNEGTTYTFNVNTTNVVNGTILYWDIVSTNNDFESVEGQFYITNNTGSFQITPTKYKDFVAEITENYTVNVRTYTPITGTSVLSYAFSVVNVNSTDVTGFGRTSVANWGPSPVAEGSTYGPFIVSSTNSNNAVVATSPILTILGDGVPTITFSSSLGWANTALSTGGVLEESVNGQPVTLNVFLSCPTTYSNGTALYWDIDALGTGYPQTGNANNDGRPSTAATTNDFSRTSGVVYVSNGSAQFNITPLWLNDTISKEILNENFRLNIRMGELLAGPVVANKLFSVHDVRKVTDTLPQFGTPEDSAKGMLATFVEGSTAAAYYVYNGYGYYWTINHITTTDADFTATSGQITQRYNARDLGYIGTFLDTGYFYVSSVTDTLTEGTETFTISIRQGSVTGTVIITSGEIRLIDVVSAASIVRPSLVITGSPYYTEGTTKTFTAYLSTAVASSTTYYWRINHISTVDADFSAVFGPLVFAAGASSATFNITTVSGVATPEPDETYTVSLVGGAPADYMYWQINHVTTSSSDFLATSGACIPGGYDYWNFNITTLLDSLTEGREKFTVSIKRGSLSNVAEITSGELTINDSSTNTTYLVLVPNTTEGATLSVRVYTPNIAVGTRLYWYVNHITTTDADFVATYGTFLTTANYSTISIVSAADSLAELDEGFTISVELQYRYQWEIEVLGSGTSNIVPEVYIFSDARATLVPPTDTMGMVVYADNGDISFDSRRGPLNITASAIVTYPNGPVNTLPTYLDTVSDSNFSTPGYLNGYEGISLSDGNASALFAPTKESFTAITGTMPAKPIFFITSLAQTEIEVYSVQTYSYSSGLFNVNSTHKWWESIYWAFYRSGIRKSGNNIYAGWITVDKNVSTHADEKTDKLFGAWSVSQETAWVYNNPISNETLNLGATAVLISDGSMYD